jgi:hypothetical protein
MKRLSLPIIAYKEVVERSTYIIASAKKCKKIIFEEIDKYEDQIIKHLSYLNNNNIYISDVQLLIDGENVVLHDPLYIEFNSKATQDFKFYCKGESRAYCVYLYEGSLLYDDWDE